MLCKTVLPRLLQSTVDRNGPILEHLKVISGYFAGCSRSICTSHRLERRRGRRSVHIPAWAKAAAKRKETLVTLLKPKSKRQLEAEIKLENRTEELNFYTPATGGPFSGWKAVARPEIIFSRDEKTIICYHPSVDYPLELTMEAVDRPLWHDETDNYKDTLTEEQTKELIALRRKDPKLWDVRSLCHLFEVKPQFVSDAVELTDEQKEALETEKSFFSQLPEQKKIRYQMLQNMERIEYIEKTRGVESARQFKAKTKTQ